MDCVSWVKQTLAVALGKKTWYFSNNCVANTFLFSFDSAFRLLFSLFLLLIFSFGMLAIIIQSVWKHDWKARWPGTKGISNTWSNFVGLVFLPSLHHFRKRRKCPLLHLLREPHGTVPAQSHCARAEQPSGGESPTMGVWSHCSIYLHPAAASKGLLPGVSRGGNTMSHPRLTGMLCAQSCLWCSELFIK